MKIRKIALKAAGSFVLLGLLWIVVTDLAASYLAPNLAQLAIFQLLKGIIFILVASGFLYHFLSSRLWRQQMNLAEELRRTEELKALAQISSEALTADSDDQILQQTVRRTKETLDYDVAFVLEPVPGGESKELAVRAAHGMPADHIPTMELRDRPSSGGTTFRVDSAEGGRPRFIVYPSESKSIFKTGFAAEIYTASTGFGFLAVFDEDDFTPSPVDHTALRSLADVLGLALTRHETHERLRLRARQNKALTELSTQALQIQELGTLFNLASAMVADQMGTDFSKLFAFDPDEQQLQLVSGVGWNEGRVGATILESGGASQAGYTLSVDEPVIVEDFRTENRFEVPELLSSHAVLSSMSVVIEGRDTPYGVIGADTKSRRRFTEDDVAFLQSIANILSEAIQRLESERTSEFQAQLLGSVGEAVIATDNEGIVQYWNPGAERLYGWSEDEAVGQLIQDLNITPANQAKAEQIMASVRTGKSWSGEFLVRNREREVFPVQVTDSPIYDRKGDMIGVVGVSRDLRDLRAIERELAESEAFHRMVLANISDAVFLTDEDGEFKFVCVNTQHIFGYSQFEVEQMGNIRELFDDDLLVDSDILEREGLVTNLELQVRDIEGAPHDLLVNVKRVRIRGGTRLYTCRDITYRKAAEMALTESEARYRSLTEDVLDSSEVGTFILDSEFKIVWINQAIEEFFGLRRERVIGRDKRQLIEESIRGLMEEPEQFRSRLFASYDDNTYRESFECHLLGANGQQERWLQHWSQPIRHGLYAGGRIEHYTDITDRKRVEFQLEKALERFQLVARTTQAALWDYHLEEDWTWRSPAYASAFGYDPEGIDSSFEYWTSRIHPEDRESVLDSLNEWIESGEEMWTVEYRFRRADGSYAWVYDRGFALHDEQGETYRAMGSMLDISERKKYERELAETAQRFELFLDATNDAIWEYDFEADELWWSDNFATMFGYAPDETGSDFISWEERVHPEDRDRVVKSIEDWRSSDRTQWSAEYRIRTADGSYAYVYDRAYGVRASDGTLERAIGSLMDITDRKQAEISLQRQQSRLQALRGLDEVLLTATSEQEMAQAALDTLGNLVASDCALVVGIDSISGTGVFNAVQGNCGPEVTVGTSFDLDRSGLQLDELQAGELVELRDLERNLAEGWLKDQAVQAGVNVILSDRLVAQDEPVGILAVGSRGDTPFDRFEKDTVQKTGDTLALAIRGARLLQQERKRAAELDALRRASLQVSSQLELSPVLDTVCQEAMQLMPGIDCNIFIYEDDELSFGAARYRDEDRADEPYNEPRENGLTNRVARSGERIVVEDTGGHPLFRDAFPEWRGAIVGIPLKYHGEVVGVMNLAFDEPQKFHVSELEVIERLGEMAAIAISNARLYQSEQRQRAQLSALLEVATDLSRQVALDAILQSIVESLNETMEAAEAATVFMLDEERDELVARAWSGHRDEDMEGLTFPRDASVAGDAVRKGQPRIYSDIQSEESFNELGNPRLDGIRSLLAVPFERDGEIMGAVFADNFSTTDAFSEADLELLKGMAAQVGIAITRAQWFEEIQESRRQLQDLSRQLVEAQESERRHLARELHDEVGQILTSLKLTLEMIDSGEEDMPAIQQAIDMTGQLLSSVRDLSLELRPSMLDDLGLHPSLEWLVDRIQEQSGVDITFRWVGPEERFDQGVETTAYRVVQEALTNVVRHSKAESAEVFVSVGGGRIELEIEDSGRGFDPEWVLNTPGHSGISGMRERVRLVGGEFDVRSESGEGSLVRVLIPVSPEEPAL